MKEDAVSLKGLPGDAADIDVAADGAWVAICRRGKELVVASAARQFAAPSDIRFPLIRWTGGGDILVVDTRTSKGRDNAHVFSRSGAQKVRFCAGDGIEDVIADGEAVVVTYFDEGVYGDVPPSHEGLCVFAPDGSLAFGYLTGVRNAVVIDDCYCICAAGGHEVCFVPYSGFPLVRLDSRTREQQVLELPDALHGASALCTDGDTFWFHGPYEQKHSILRWRPDELPVAVGTHAGRLRAWSRGAFLATGPSGYTILRPPSARPGVDRS